MNVLLFRFFVAVLLLSCISLVSCSSKDRVMEEPLVTNTGSPRKYQPPVEERIEKVDFNPKKAYFDFDKSILKSAGKNALKASAEWLKKNPEAVVQIEGYCDERGSEAYNLGLGERRAKAAYQYLLSLGVDPKRLSVISGGKLPGLDEKIMARNRNAGLVIVFAK